MENRDVFAKGKNRHNQVLKYALKYIKEIMIEKSTSAYLWGRSLSVEISCAEKYDILEKLEIFLSPLTNGCVRKTTTNFRIFEFTKVSGRNTFSSYRLSTANLYFFMRTT